MSVKMMKQNGSVTDTMKFDDDFVVSKTNSSIRNRSFKPPSPLFQQKPEDLNLVNNFHKDSTALKNISNGKIAGYVSDELNRRSSNRSRRTSTPPFSTEYNHKSKLETANSQASIPTSSPRSVSTSSSPQIQPKRRSSSSFIKKLSFKFKSSSNRVDSTERTPINQSDNQFSNYRTMNRYGSVDNSSNEVIYTNRPKVMSTVSTQTNTDLISKQSDNNHNKNTSNLNNNVERSNNGMDQDAMRKVFNVFDSDHDGSITIEDVEKVMNSLQHLKDEIEMPSVSQIKVAFDKFDANKNGSIEFNEFLEILRCADTQNLSDTDESSFSSKSNNINSKATNVTYNTSSSSSMESAERVKTNMRLMFEQFDKDNDGKITKPELNFVMQNLFPDEVITDKDIEDMLRAADLDKNGFIDFDEFANMFMLHTTNTAVVQTNIEPTSNNGTPNINNNSYSRTKNTSVTNLKKSEVTKSNKSLSKTLSRSSSKEPSRSRNPSGQRSEQNSPRNYKKFVQIFTASQMMDLKAAFHMFDKNGDQKISEKELFEVMKYLGVQATEQDVKAMIQVVDKNKNGCVDYDEFIQMMTKTQLKPLSQEEELRKTFNIFDIDGNGFICHDEIKKTMSHLGENISDAEVRDMIRAADKNGDGKIDINEFSGLLNGTNVFKS